MFLAGIEHGHDVGVVEAPGGFRLAEEALLDLDQFVGLELLRQGHGLDRHDAVDLRVAAEIDHAHGALAQFLLDLVAAQHRLLDIAGGIDQAGIAAPASASAENHGFRQLFGAIDAGLDIAEFRVVIEYVAEHRLGLVELALAFEVQRQVVHVLHQRVVHRALAELVEGHVELALALEGQAQHAVRFGRIGIRFFLAAFGDDEALDRQQQMADQQQARRHHELQPHQLRRHQHEMNGDQRDQQTGRNHGRHSGPDPRQEGDQVDGDQKKYQPFGPDAPGRRDKEMLGQQARNSMRLHQHRRHGRADRSNEDTAHRRRGRSDQDDLVAILVVGNLAALDIEEGIDREMRHCRRGPCNKRSAFANRCPCRS